MYRHNGKVPRDRKDVDAKIVKSIVNQYRKLYSNKQIYTALNLPKTTFYRWLNSSDKEISEDYAQNNILAKVRRKKRKFNSGATSVIVSNIFSSFSTVIATSAGCSSFNNTSPLASK